MASPNFTLWRHAADKGEVRKATWVCGDQVVLVEEVVDTTRAQLGVADLNYIRLHAGTVPDRDIWAAAHQYPLTPDTNRLVVVRDAHRITNWAPLPQWLTNAGRHLPYNHLLFIDPHPDFPTVGATKTLAPHVEAIRGKGRIVRCGMPNENDAVAWVRARGGLDDTTARHLLTRVGANLAQAANVCAKLRLFAGTPSPATIDALQPASPADDFVDSLIALRRDDALQAAAGLTDSDRLRVIGLLDSRLDLLAALWRAGRTHTSLREIRDVPVFLARKFMPHAKHYPPARCAYDRRLLAVSDQAHRRGARTAVLESLVALW